MPIKQSPATSPNKLFVDAGNTNVKWCLGVDGSVHKAAAGSQDFFDWLRSARADIGWVALSSVRPPGWNIAFEALCQELELPCWFASAAAQDSGLVSAYSKPETLGVDRWLAMLSIWQQTKRAFLLVDAGTAVTLDLVDNSGQHLGGYILPGLELQKTSLLKSSEVLADLLSKQQSKPEQWQSGLAGDTKGAIHQGIFAALQALVEKLARDGRLEADQLFLTGGDAGPLAVAIGCGELLENPVLSGLAMVAEQAGHKVLTEVRL